ncbi:monocarboxylate transporter 13 isoform X2 [Lingula anatina]|uniref:Monocarboxylate transporter 13 isoform X2 n=1 Tax=Lingula anatina TaxID=7574 RepID=A0A1S3HIR8_LINAN|nr:monocarboxylate transporter 13 isoform X2 [Lingula anatina]|eukprot:XP_013386015.1 monocarboxylate transporter 13 isoform X2 [Lingula anatina]
MTFTITFNILRIPLNRNAGVTMNPQDEEPTMSNTVDPHPVSLLHRSETILSGGKPKWALAIDPMDGKQTFCSTDPREKERKIRQCLIVFAAFITFFCVCGFAYSIGVYFEEFLHVFQQRAGDTAWVGSLNFGMLCLSGPVSSIVSERFSCRVVVMVGGLTACAGLVLSAFATSISYLYVTLGILTGFGFGLCFSATVFVVSLAFDRHRSLAMGISMSGVGAGMVVQPYLIEYLIHRYGWRGSMLILAGLMLQSVVCGALMKLPTAKYMTCSPECERASERKPKIIDLGIFVNFNYVALTANIFLFCLGMSVVLVHLPHVADTLSFSHDQSALLISIIGITNTIGRTLSGVVGNLHFVNVTLLYGLSYVIAGLATLFYPSSGHYAVMVICSVIYGLFTAAFGSLLSDVLLRIIGKDRFTAGYGMLMVFGGIGTTLGAPLAGWLYDGLHDYQPSFYLGGGALTLSGLIMFIPWKFENYPTNSTKKNTIGFLECEKVIPDILTEKVPTEEILVVISSV